MLLPEHLPSLFPVLGLVTKEPRFFKTDISVVHFEIREYLSVETLSKDSPILCSSILPNKGNLLNV